MVATASTQATRVASMDFFCISWPVNCDWACKDMPENTIDINAANILVFMILLLLNINFLFFN